MTAFLHPADTVDLTSEFWRVPGISTDLVIEQLGVRLNLSHWQRVQCARRTLEQSVAVSDLHPDPRPLG